MFETTAYREKVNVVSRHKALCAKQPMKSPTTQHTQGNFGTGFAAFWMEVLHDLSAAVVISLLVENHFLLIAYQVFG